jgi:hypothetical protein
MKAFPPKKIKRKNINPKKKVRINFFQNLKLIEIYKQEKKKE